MVVSFVSQTLHENKQRLQITENRLAGTSVILRYFRSINITHLPPSDPAPPSDPSPPSDPGPPVDPASPGDPAAPGDPAPPGDPAQVDHATVTGSDI